MPSLLCVWSRPGIWCVLSSRIKFPTAGVPTMISNAATRPLPVATATGAVIARGPVTGPLLRLAGAPTGHQVASAGLDRLIRLHNLVGGAVFQNLATVQISGNTLQVVLSDNADGYVVADAIRLVPIPPLA